MTKKKAFSPGYRPEFFRSDEERDAEIEEVEASLSADIATYGVVSGGGTYNLYFVASVFEWCTDISPRMPESVLQRWARDEQQAKWAARIKEMKERGELRHEY